jgi:hypothetical protein
VQGRNRLRRPPLPRLWRRAQRAGSRAPLHSPHPPSRCAVKNRAHQTCPLRARTHATTSTHTHTCTRTTFAHTKRRKIARPTHAGTHTHAHTSSSQPRTPPTFTASPTSRTAALACRAPAFALSLALRHSIEGASSARCFIGPPSPLALAGAGMLLLTYRTHENSCTHLALVRAAAAPLSRLTAVYCRPSSA